VAKRTVKCSTSKGFRVHPAGGWRGRIRATTAAIQGEGFKTLPKASGWSSTSSVDRRASGRERP